MEEGSRTAQAVSRPIRLTVVAAFIASYITLFFSCERRVLESKSIVRFSGTSRTGGTDTITSPPVSVVAVDTVVGVGTLAHSAGRMAFGSALKGTRRERSSEFGDAGVSRSAEAERTRLAEVGVGQVEA